MVRQRDDECNPFSEETDSMQTGNGKLHDPFLHGNSKVGNETFKYGSRAPKGVRGKQKQTIRKKMEHSLIILLYMNGVNANGLKRYLTGSMERKRRR
jgi:hypothetical protein